MVKRKEASKSLGFSTWDVNVYIRECPNIVRWNPRLAIDWMEAIAVRVWSDIQTQAYNHAAKKINQYLDHLETCRYYDKRGVWENDSVRRVKLLETYD
jgi:hypothetical protein